MTANWVTAAPGTGDGVITVGAYWRSAFTTKVGTPTQAPSVGDAESTRQDWVSDGGGQFLPARRSSSRPIQRSGVMTWWRSSVVADRALGRQRRSCWPGGVPESHWQAGLRINSPK